MQLATIVSKNFSRLIKISNDSSFSASRPKFSDVTRRPFQTAVRPPDLAVEKATRRAGSLFLLRADVSQFYPSLYTHAVGWAVDPKLRQKTNWRNTSLLGKKIDSCLMNLDGKISQGIPIGGDISFLLAECVLARVDRALGVEADRSYRWFDDYELAFETREQAEACLKRLSSELGKYRLRLNPVKTKIINLPIAGDEDWQRSLVQTGHRQHLDSRSLLSHFDTAFRFRDEFPESPVLLYAISVLFGVACPSESVGKVAQSFLSQALLAEPGAAQKAFALLSYWATNGFRVDHELLKKTINRLVIRHEAGGVSSDVSWALSFCLEQKISLGAQAGKVLANVEDDFIALQSLHMYNVGLLPKGFSTSSISKLIRDADLDREHWLLCYESLRTGFLNDAAPIVSANGMFSQFLASGVTFYQTSLPRYSTVTHPGGAPDWLLQRWMRTFKAEQSGQPRPTDGTAMPLPIEEDLLRRGIVPGSGEEALSAFLGLLSSEGAVDEVHITSYSM